MREILEQRILEAPVERVVSRFGERGWLERGVEAAGIEAAGIDSELRVEVGRAPVKVDVHKRVRLEIGEPESLSDRTVVPITWEAAGFSGFFPVMDAIVEIRPRGRHRSHVLFWGRYDPPLGRVGDLVDRTIAHRVAERTVSRLLDALAEQVGTKAAASGVAAGG